MTQGIISGLGREVTVTDQLTRRQTTLANLIQTDAAIDAAAELVAAAIAGEAPSA